MTERHGDACRNRIVTIPNVLCSLRLAGAFSLIGIALWEREMLFTGVFVILSLTDWVDGKLARWLDQRSDFGARLDSLADFVLYTTTAFGTGWMRWEQLSGEWPWIIAAVASYTITTAAGLFKYGRIPSYHTYGAKISHWLMFMGAVSLMLNVSIWPLRLALFSVTLTNLEATAMTAVLSEWHADVLGFTAARRLERAGKAKEKQSELSGTAEIS